jgi:hypothetical protein
MKPIVAVLLSAVLAACAPSSAPQDARASDAPPAAPAIDAPTPAARARADAKADTGQVARLEREARALAHTEGCSAGACRTAPLGSRPCGGPREYLVYCAATTDSAALFAKLAELARAEEAINRDSGTMSTCEYRMPPNATVQGGRCVATPSNEPPVQ